MKIYRYKKYIRFILLALYLMPGIDLTAQTVHQAASFELSAPVTGNVVYEASDYVKLKPGFSYTPITNESFIAKINKDIILQSVTYNDNTVTINTPIDQTLAVGSIQGLFDVSASGAASYQIPIDVPPGTAGLDPKVSLVYNSQGGNGLLGIGFSLSGFSMISRCGQNLFDDDNVSGVKFNNTLDKFMLDGQRLIESSGTYGANQAEYKTELESFSKIVSYGTSGSGPLYFKVWTKDGSVYEYGNTEDARIQAQGNNSPNVLTWLLNRITDANGNYMTFSYVENQITGEWWPKEILYTGNADQGITTCNKVTFTYENNRYDKNTLYTHGSKIEQNVLLTSIKTYNENSIVKEYDLNYSFDFYSHLDKVTETIQGEQLNSTVFKWGDGVSQSENQVESPAISHDGVATNYTIYNDPDQYLGVPPKDNVVLVDGDFNGDGLPDIMRIWYGNPDHNYDTYNVYLGVKTGNTISYDRKSSGYRTYYSDASFTSVDINADGISEIISIGTGGWGKIFKFDSNFKLTPLISSVLTDPDFEPSGYLFNYDYNELANDLKNFIQIGDINGDGLTDFLYRCREWCSTPNSEGFHYYWKIAGYQYNGQSLSWNGDWNPPQYINNLGICDFNDLNFFVGKNFWEAKNVFLSDFNGDGKSEVLVNNEIWEYNIASINFTQISVTNLTDYDNDQIKFGDFNGDGNADVVYKQLNSNDWYVAINDGNANFNKQYFLTATAEYIPPPHVGSNLTTRNKEFIDCADFNGDGKTDILYRTSTWMENINISPFSGDTLISPAFPPLESSFLENVYYSEGNGSWDPKIFHSSLPFDSKEKALINDFNGDGKIDFYDGENLMSFKPYNINHLITSIKNGSANYINIEYTPLTNNEYYSKDDFGYWVINQNTGNNDYWINSKYPYTYIASPIYVVSKTFSDIGLITMSDEHNYNYKNALVYLRGKGFLGFEEITDNSVNNLTKKKTMFDNKYYNNPNDPWSYTLFPFLYNSKTFLVNTSTDPEQDISSVENIYHLKTYGTSKLTYLPYTYSTISNDKLTNTSSISKITGSSTEPDQYGNITEITTENAAGLSTSSAPGTVQWTTITHNTYENQVGINYRRLGLLSSSKITKQKTGEVPYISYSENTYDQNNGNLLTQTIEPRSVSNDNYINNPDDVVSILKTYNYGAIKTGLPASSSTLYTDKTSSYLRDEITYGYDPLYRFVTSKTNALGQTNTFAYEYKFGNLVAKSDANSHFTSYIYDALGRVTSSTDPDGIVTTCDYPWASATANPPSLALYATTTARTGEAPVTIYYDRLGRTLRSETINMNSNTVLADKTYDTRGRLATESLPYIIGGTKQDITYTYEDATNRPLSKTGPGIDLTYQYDNSTTEVLNNIDGTYSAQTADAAGSVTQSFDAGGIIQYDYYSSGLNKTITDPAENVTTITYDHLGNKLTLSDPDAGLTTYTYYAYGQLKSQTDARGKTTELQYDILNRITQRKEPAADHGNNITNYVYDTKLHGIGLLSSLSTTYGTIEPVSSYAEDYTYDSHSRMSSKTTSIDGIAYIENYAYNTLGRLENYTYPYVTNPELTTQYVYDAVTGDLKQVLNATTSDVIWECSLVNAMGQIELYKTANGVIKTDNIYDPLTHLLTGINTYTGSHTNAVYKQKLEYTYNSKLLLETRSNNLIPLTETFTYDNMNRLTSSQVTGQAAIATAFDNETGNISAKAGIGAYDYSLPQPHAVGTITPEAGHESDVCAEQQDITYTSFNKVKTVTEGDNTLDIGYGASHQRIITVLKNDGTVIKTKLFIGGTYEKENLNGTERNLYYISASNGLVAIYEKIGSNTAMHYVYKDNLGSYNVITDASGTIEENLSFDAWGRRRDPATWTFYASGTEPTHIFDRGFTGHEHLDEFGLINMNGRMYDPKVGAFLSPDVFANTSSTQGLNRYSYCLNNPLEYVDPSGYLAIGGGANYSPTSANAELQNASNNWFTGITSNCIKFLYGVTEDGYVGLEDILGNNITFSNTEELLNKLAGAYVKNDHIWYVYYTLDIPTISELPYNLPTKKVLNLHNLKIPLFGPVHEKEYPGVDIYYDKGRTDGFFFPGLGIHVSKNPGESWKQHEYGHYLQYLTHGISYYLSIVATQSAGNALASNYKGHNNLYVEVEANTFAYNFFGKSSKIALDEDYPTFYTNPELKIFPFEDFNKNYNSIKSHWINTYEKNKEDFDSWNSWDGTPW